MDNLIYKLIPLYFLIFLGFIAGKYLRIPAKSLADLTIFILAPVVFFGYVAQVDFDFNRMLLPIFTFIIPCIISLVSLYIGKFIFKDNRLQLASASTSSGNTGYFGLPVFIAFFGDKELGLYTLAVVGGTIFESSLGYFILARGRYNAKDALLKVIRLPILYATLAGVLFSIFCNKLPEAVTGMISQFRSAYVIIGMMLIGIALTKMTKFEIDYKYLFFSYIGRFIVFPLVSISVILLYRMLSPLNDVVIIQALAVIASVPMAANLTAYASQLEYHPEKAACAVLISTLIAIVTIPIVVPLFVEFLQ